MDRDFNRPLNPVECGSSTRVDCDCVLKASAARHGPVPLPGRRDRYSSAARFGCEHPGSSIHTGRYTRKALALPVASAAFLPMDCGSCADPNLELPVVTVRSSGYPAFRRLMIRSSTTGRATVSSCGPITLDRVTGSLRTIRVRVRGVTRVVSSTTTASSCSSLHCLASFPICLVFVGHSCLSAKE